MNIGEIKSIISKNVTKFVRIIVNPLPRDFYRSFVYSQFPYHHSCIVIAKTLQKARAVSILRKISGSVIAKYYKRKHESHARESRMAAMPA